MFIALTHCKTLIKLSAKQKSAMHMSTNSLSGRGGTLDTFDEQYPGTAVERMYAIRDRVKALTTEELNGKWDFVRKNILRAGGLRDEARLEMVGKGYTGHSFNDYNHVDLTAMRGEEADNENAGRVEGMHYSNKLGEGIKRASIGPPELPPGGSWSTCQIGAGKSPPADVAHIQFRSRIAFKLVWCPPKFKSCKYPCHLGCFDSLLSMHLYPHVFYISSIVVLVDDDGKYLSSGQPSDIDDESSGIPSLEEREANYLVVKGSKYATMAERRGGEVM
jgi:hypothetical protein